VSLFFKTLIKLHYDVHFRPYGLSRPSASRGQREWTCAIGFECTTLKSWLRQSFNWCSGQCELCTPPPLPSPGQGSMWIWCQIDGESWGAKYFFTVDFRTTTLKLCAVNLLNTWVLIVFIFVELSVVNVSNTKCRPTPPSVNAQCTDNFLAGVLVVYWKLIAMSVSRKVHNTNSTWIIFIYNQ
jgi:hypothetical protein